jgi:hypothetical protein
MGELQERPVRRPRRRVERFARATALRRVLSRVRSMVPDVIPDSEDVGVRILTDARLAQINRLPRIQSSVRGRWPRVDLDRVWTALSIALERERQPTIAPEQFVVRYLPLLLLPHDVTAALEAGRIDVDEAEVVARLTEGRIRLPTAVVAELREREIRLLEMIDLPLDVFAERIDKVLRDARASYYHHVNEYARMVLQFEPTPTFGSKHLFWDQIALVQLGLADVRYSEVTERDVVDVLAAVDQIVDVLLRIRRRRARRS